MPTYKVDKHRDNSIHILSAADSLLLFVLTFYLILSCIHSSFWSITSSVSIWDSYLSWLNCNIALPLFTNWVSFGKIRITKFNQWDCWLYVNSDSQHSATVKGPMWRGVTVMPHLDLDHFELHCWLWLSRLHRRRTFDNFCLEAVITAELDIFHPPRSATGRQKSEAS